MPALLFALTLLGPAALANGQTTHIWITRHALTHLPEGELKALLSRPDLESMLIHGTMFPDGGYPLGHPYAETAHWEPFQNDYMDWILDQGAPPLNAEQERHVAFWMGMASHGMADQSFDAFYFDWSRFYDAEHGWAVGQSFDESSDIIWASLTGPQVVPERWLPVEPFIPLYAAHGIEVDGATLNEGQDLLELAVALVGGLGQIPQTVALHKAYFPWGGSHLDDERLPGQPACEGQVVALYWQELWARLHGAAEPQRVLRTWPQDGAFGHSTDATLPDARVSVIFSKGAPEGSISADFFEIADSTGAPLPFDTWIFYGSSSHVVHLVPREDFAPDSSYTVTVRAGVPGNDGSLMQADQVFGFSTRLPPPDSDSGAERDDPPTDRHASTQPGRGCTSAPRQRGGLGGAMLLALAAAISGGRRRS